jgi:hypothetical protein
MDAPNRIDRDIARRVRWVTLYPFAPVRFGYPCGAAVDSGKREKGSQQSDGDVYQPDRILANGFGCDQAEWWPGPGKVRLAAAKHKRAKVETILIDKSEVRETPRQIGPGNFDVALDFRLQSAHERFEFAFDKRGVRTYRFQGT